MANLVPPQAIGGSIWHGVKGFRNSPYGERRIGALTAVKARAPVLGGNFAVWGGLFSTFDCAIKGLRKKEDPYNASTWFPPTSASCENPRKMAHGLAADTWLQLSPGSLPEVRWLSEEAGRLREIQG